MSTSAGTLLWNRRRIILTSGSTDIDTGLQQPQQGFGNSSIDEPPLGIPGVSAPPDGTTPASRVQVIPLPPTNPWQFISISEPWVNTATGTVFVTFQSDAEDDVEINVLFWDPHTSVGPGQADTYNQGKRQPQPKPTPAKK